MIYAYKTINIINNKFYFGIHKSLTGRVDNYIGCGIRRQSDAKLNTKFHNAVRKYGYGNFRVEVSKIFSCYKDALLWEKQFITKEMIDSIECYNSKFGGKGGGYAWSEERKKYHKEKNTYKKSDLIKDKIKKAAISRFKVEKGTFFGKTHTLETREKLSLVRKGLVSKNKNKKLNLTQEQRTALRERFLKNVHSKCIEVNKRFSKDIELEIKNKYTGTRGEKVKLAAEYKCSISLITKIVGISFKHKK